VTPISYQLSNLPTELQWTPDHATIESCCYLFTDPVAIQLSTLMPRISAIVSFCLYVILSFGFGFGFVLG
jgi:hypothetical protein